MVKPRLQSPGSGALPWCWLQGSAITCNRLHVARKSRRLNDNDRIAVGSWVHDAAYWNEPVVWNYDAGPNPYAIVHRHVLTNLDIVADTTGPINDSVAPDHDIIANGAVVDMNMVASGKTTADDSSVYSNVIAEMTVDTKLTCPGFEFIAELCTLGHLLGVFVITDELHTLVGLLRSHFGHLLPL